MDSVRLTPADYVFPRLPCDRCGDTHGNWDRLVGLPLCPNCLEALAVGEGAPLVVHVEKRRCAVCYHLGTLCFQTFPLNWERPVELDLCGEHLRGLIGRRLGPHAFEQLRRQLGQLGLDVGQVFLLHEAFYDVQGRALQPASEC